MSRVTGIAIDVYPSGADPSSVTAGGSAWTYGSWVQVIASASAALHIAGVVVGQTTSSTNLQFEIDIGIGAAAAETSVHTFRSFFPSTSAETKNSLVLFPVPIGGIASGNRVSVRVRTAVGGEVIPVGLMAYASLGDTDHLTSKSMLSAPAGANAVSITPNATAWAYSSWVEVFSGTAVETAFLGLAARGPIGPVELEYEIGFGAAGLEVGKTAIRTSSWITDLGGLRNFFLPVPHVVPANTRVSVRLRKTGTSTTVHSVAMLYLNDTDTGAVTKSASEAITVTDAVTAVLTNDIYKTVFETITVSESTTQRPSALLLRVYETIGISENYAAPLGISPGEGIRVRDVVTLATNRLVIRVWESISVSDSPLNRNPRGVAGTIGPEPSAPTGSTGRSDYWVVGL